MKSRKTLSLLAFVVSAMVLLIIPTTQAQAPVPAPNDRCANPQDVAVPIGTPRSSARQCFFFDTSAATAGPIGADVVRDLDDTNDVWFRIMPPCAPMNVFVAATASSYPTEITVVTVGGGSPFFVCDTDLDGTGENFFDSDFVLLGGSVVQHTIGATLAGRDFYYLVTDAAQVTGGLLRVCFTTACL